MKRLKLIGKVKWLFIIVLVLTAFFACKKEDPPPPPPTTTTTVQEDKDNINNALDGLNTCITDIQNGEGAQVIIDFLDLDQLEIKNEDWIQQMLDSIAEIVDVDDIEDNNKFDMTLNSGTYTYNNTTKVWTKIASPADQIIVEFPGKPTTSGNDLIFTLSEYKDASYQIDGETIWLPTSVKANMTSAGAEVFSFDGTFTYVESGSITLPTLVDAEVYLKPYTFDINGKRNNSKDFDATVVIHNNGQCKFTSSAYLKLQHDDYENLYWEDGFDDIGGSFVYGSLQIIGSVDAKSLGAIEDPTTAQINAMTTAEVYYAGQKVGDLVYVEGTNEDYVQIVYKDGSAEDTKVYWDPFVQKLEDKTISLFGDWYEI